MIRHCLLAITMLSPSLSPFLSLAITYLSVARVKQFEFRTPSCISQILFAHRDTASDAVTAIARTQITEFGTEHRPRKKKPEASASVGNALIIGELSSRAREKQEGFSYSTAKENA